MSLVTDRVIQIPMETLALLHLLSAAPDLDVAFTDAADFDAAACNVMGLATAAGEG